MWVCLKKLFNFKKLLLVMFFILHRKFKKTYNVGFFHIGYIFLHFGVESYISLYSSLFFLNDSKMSFLIVNRTYDINMKDYHVIWTLVDVGRYRCWSPLTSSRKQPKFNHDPRFYVSLYSSDRRTNVWSPNYMVSHVLTQRIKK